MLVALLGIGTTEDTFHFWGTLPLVMDQLKSIVKELVIERAVPLSIFPEIPSGPEALLVSRPVSRLKTTCSVQRILSGGRDDGSAVNY